MVREWRGKPRSFFFWLSAIGNCCLKWQNNSANETYREVRAGTERLRTKMVQSHTVLLYVARPKTTYKHVCIFGQRKKKGGSRKKPKTQFRLQSEKGNKDRAATARRRSNNKRTTFFPVASCSLYLSLVSLRTH